jgi:hypothetical protein
VNGLVSEDVKVSLKAMKKKKSGRTKWSYCRGVEHFRAYNHWMVERYFQESVYIVNREK